MQTGSHSTTVIPGFSRYGVTKDGSVFSSSKRIQKRPLAYAALPAERSWFVHPVPTFTAAGYLRVCIVNDDGKRLNIGVHRLVCLTYLGEPPAGRTICRHISKDVFDNRSVNLAWGARITVFAASTPKLQRQSHPRAKSRKLTGLRFDRATIDADRQAASRYEAAYDEFEHAAG